MPGRHSQFNFRHHVTNFESPSNEKGSLQRTDNSLGGKRQTGDTILQSSDALDSSTDVECTS